MKYCVKCGTLLEDSQDRCIGCGASVSEDGTWSLYPPEMAKKIEIEKSETKSRGGLIAAMVIVFILLIAAIAFFIIFNVKKSTEEAASDKALTVKEELDADVSELEQDAVEELKEEETASEEVLIKTPELPDSESSKTASSSDREIKDSSGKYYSVGTVKDAGGNTIFSTIFPEDLSEKATNINYGIYSTKYPESLTYIVGDDDGGVLMKYMSPQHFWYRKSDKGQTRSNERDVIDYMQFLTYNGAKGYIEELIKLNYTDIKGFKLVGTEELAPEISTKLKEVSDAHTNELLGDIGDYAKIASDTVYAAMEAECEANIYHYEATSRQGNTIYMDFYVPVIANKLGYVSDHENDKGEVTEWLIPAYIALEAGNEEIYNLYKDDFKLFIYNSKLTEEFFYINNTYSEEIETAIKAKREPAELNASKLSEIHKGFKTGAKLSEYTKNVQNFLDTYPLACTLFSGKEKIVALNNAKVGFYSQEKNKVFISPVEDEYPGSDYEDLELHESSVVEDSNNDESAPSSGLE